MQESDVKIRWQNFRSFKDTGWLKIKPITILIGPNNAGKTSVLAPLLLLNQTLNSIDGHRALITRGELIDVGNYKDLIHNHDTNLPLSLTIGYEHIDSNMENLGDVTTTPTGALEVAFDHGPEDDISLKSYAVFDRYGRPLFTRTRNKFGSFSLRGEIRTRDMSNSERKMLRNVSPINFFFSPSPTLYAHPRRAPSRRGPFTDSFSRYLVAISHVHVSLRDFFFGLGYLGPIRSWPRRYYEVLTENRHTVGPRGEYAAALLHANGENHQNLAKWVRAFEFGENIECSQSSDDFFEVRFSDKHGQETNIVDVGFGASQLLPLLVQALSLSDGAIFAAEQPEIHLNPRLQGMLADLFAEIATAGKRVIVETHSEHLLLRLRRLVAEGAISRDQIALYYVEKRGGRSTIREVQIEANGHVSREEWPRDFFQDGLRESLALAAAQAERLGN